MPKMAMVFAIAASVLGQVTGSRAERYVVKSVAQKKMTLAGPNVSSVEATHMQFPRFSSDGRPTTESLSSRCSMSLILGASMGIESREEDDMRVIDVLY
uniref:Uncharacterized protein n=1 Tax=Brassica campestris TaxID=3711 RepID=M4DRQ2_BRACM